MWSSIFPLFQWFFCFLQLLFNYILQIVRLWILQKCFCGLWLLVPYCAHLIGQHGVLEKHLLNMTSSWRSPVFTWSMLFSSVSRSCSVSAEKVLLWLTSRTFVTGCPGQFNEHGICKWQWCSGHQHDICHLVCCDCIGLSDSTLQTHVHLVCRAFGGSVLHWWSRGMYIVPSLPLILL